MIINFLKTGLLGQIKCGLSKNSILEMLGEPEDKSYSKKSVEIWKYGDLQLSFDKQGLTFIGVYFSKEKASLPIFMILDVDVGKVMELEDFKRILLREKIPFQIDNRLTFDDQIGIITESNVVAIFLNNILHSIQYIQIATDIKSNKPTKG